MIHPVLLCGGSGARLWPLSRKSLPKQFSRFQAGDTLFQASIRRLTGPDFAPPLVVTANDFRFIVMEQLGALGVTPAGVLIEPDPRNTAPAILAAALWLQSHDPNALMLVAPSDHLIPDGDGFRAVVASAVDTAMQGRMVTFGIQPEWAETGYGWLELAAAPDDLGPQAQPLLRFVEKPDATTASTMLEAGNYLWNAGIFLSTVDTLIEAFQVHAPVMLEAVRAAVAEAAPDLDFIRLSPEPWSSLEADSLDYAVMEKADNLSVVPYAGRWTDLGDWEAVRREAGPDHRGVSIQGAALALDCADSLLRSEPGGPRLVGLGLTDVIAVAMPDAVLVMDRSRAQEVRRAVSALRSEGAAEAETFPREHRPWGSYDSLASEERFRVRRLVVNPGAALSLQSHARRTEHWIVVEGRARVTIDAVVTHIEVNQSICIPFGAVHRLENPGAAPLVLIEVQTGDYFEEDDTVRYDRPPG
ncbi:MAG: mannose-1-phosphate guanylyltransferase/mannose-6-phosphate isomerase [Brevundimonas sp.]|uniref:mannose-1-phosphate guanylyltransferase/mannose-6-phosphate isomerase n=1 Tax=Brevundimonas sp. TaxID=1871086 RepID=UPI004033AB37